MLVHAKHRWPQAINAHLWPYAIRFANDVHMHAPNKDGKTPLHLFSMTANHAAPKHFHPFGCPVYVLSSKMQSDQKGPKWDERARIGINLDNSPLHARNIALVLNLDTGLVSPQFHVAFDDLFETVPGQRIPIHWPKRTGFIKTTEDAPTKPLVPDSYMLPLKAATPIEGDLPTVQGSTITTEVTVTTEVMDQGTTVSEGAQPQASTTQNRR